MRMKDKVAIVTGASGGLGSEIARAFGREGAHVVAIAGRSLEAAEKLAEEIVAEGGTAFAKMWMSVLLPPLRRLSPKSTID